MRLSQPYRNPIQPDLLRLRDPYVLQHEGIYYLYGTTAEWWGKGGDGFDAFRSRDLLHWEGPSPIYRRPAGATWNRYQFWAPECCYRDGRFYLFFGSKSDDACRALGVAVSDSPLGPFVDGPRNPITPPEWECLDAHLYTAPDGKHYLFYVHEWVQCGIGEMYVQEMAGDLCSLTGERHLLFRADAASWANAVIDGPSLIVREGRYYLMWSSFLKGHYCVGYATADSLLGPYAQSAAPIIVGGGHNSWFVGPDGETLLTSYHSPNKTPNERVHIDRLLFDAAGNLSCGRCLSS